MKFHFLILKWVFLILKWNLDLPYFEMTLVYLLHSWDGTQTSSWIAAFIKWNKFGGTRFRTWNGTELYYIYILTHAHAHMHTWQKVKKKFFFSTDLVIYIYMYNSLTQFRFCYSHKSFPKFNMELHYFPPLKWNSSYPCICRSLSWN